jgi:Polyketide cyclase / dehydrase and lipid transport.
MMKSLSSLILFFLATLFAVASADAGQGCPILSTPSYGTANAIFTVCANATIHAPASLVYSILTDFDSYHEWNTFVIDVKLLTSPPYQPGSHMRFTSAGLFGPTEVKATSFEVITSLSPEDTTAVWRYDSPAPALILAEQVSQVVPIDQHTAVYNSWETYYQAPGGVTVEMTLGNELLHAFAVQAGDLKSRAERLA